MAYGGLIPFKTDPTTPLIADICVADYDSIKLIHVPSGMGQEREIARYKTILADDLTIANDFFNVGTTEYPVFFYDFTGLIFSAQFFQINTPEKIDALMRVFQLFAKRNVEINKLLKTFFTKKEAFTKKLKVVASGTKYDADSLTTWINFDLIAGYPVDVLVYKNIVFDWINFVVGINLNTSDYLSWVNYELLPSVTPTAFRITFTINSVSKMATVNRVIGALDSDNCGNIYKILYDCFTDILTY